MSITSVFWNLFLVFFFVLGQLKQLTFKRHTLEWSKDLLVTHTLLQMGLQAPVRDSANVVSVVSKIIIYLKTLPILYNWNDRAINFFIECWILHTALWPRPRFSANSKGACALCLRNSIACFGCVAKVPGRCYMACRHEKEKHWACRNGRFLCKLRLNITYTCIVF